MEYSQKLRQKFSQINIIYETVISQVVKINCSFPNEMHLRYRSTFNEGKKTRHNSAWACYYC